jgi:hypothetical protein
MARLVEPSPSPRTDRLRPAGRVRAAVVGRGDPRGTKRMTDQHAEHDYPRRAILSRRSSQSTPFVLGFACGRSVLTPSHRRKDGQPSGSKEVYRLATKKEKKITPVHVRGLSEPSLYETRGGASREPNQDPRRGLSPVQYGVHDGVGGVEVRTLPPGAGNTKPAAHAGVRWGPQPPPGGSPLRRSLNRRRALLLLLEPT